MLCAKGMDSCQNKISLNWFVPAWVWSDLQTQVFSPRAAQEGAGLSPSASAEQGGKEGRKKEKGILGVVLSVFHPVITDDELDTERS